MTSFFAQMALAAALAAPSAPADACAEASCRVSLTGAQVLHLSEQFAVSGRTDEAEALLAGLSQDAEPEIRMEAAFRLGRMRLLRGDAKAARIQFARLLEKRPNAAPVRVELARALVALGKHDAAERQLRRAQSAGLPSEVRLALNRMASALRSTNRWGGSVEVGIAPDTNVNQATDSKSIDMFGLPLQLSEEARGQSGVGATFSAHSFYRHPLSDGINLLGTVSARGQRYDLSAANESLVSVTLGPEIGRSLRPSVTVNRRWIAGTAYSLGYGAGLLWMRPVSSRSQAQLSVSAQRSVSDRSDAQDAVLVNAELALEHALSPTLYARAAVMGGQHNAREDFYSSRYAGGEILVSKDIGPLILFSRLGYSNLRGGQHLPQFGARRVDHRWEGSAGLSWRRIDIGGATPVIRVTVTDNDSSLPLYSFGRIRTEIALTRPF